jgi:peptidoglycan/xylan/chitin deacetylase (PgdA/CDA1 family)/folate-dependent phosphoribosylglycinamide formyltransferase PurN
VRVVVFTADPNLTDTPWWQALISTPAVADILVCRRTSARRPKDVVRRLRQNVAHHGILWIPYRTALLVRDWTRRFFVKRHQEAAGATNRAVEEFQTPVIHATQVLEVVRGFNADLGISLGAPVLRRQLFGLPRLGTINLHLGKVPDFRGAPVGFWELERGATVIGATVHWIDDGLDTGPVLEEGEAPIYTRDTLRDVQSRAGELGSRLLRSTLERLARDKAALREQPVTNLVANQFPTLTQRLALDWRTWRRRAPARLWARRAAKWSAMLVALYFYRPIRDVMRSIRRRHPVRVFTFHRVTYLCRDGMTVSPDVFESQVEYLARHHDILSLEEGLSIIRNSSRLKRPAAVLTFDDGYRSVFETARPVLSRHGIQACCFVCTDVVGTTQRFAHDRESPVREHLDVMNWEELADLLACGWSVGSHTATHARLSTCENGVLQRELDEPRRALRDRLHIKADVLAYPFGSREDLSPHALSAAEESGYSTVFSNFNGENTTGDQSILLKRIDIGGDHEEVAWRTLIHGIDLGRWKRYT